ncbi:PREDICTED: basic-leucine zipper transcription factor A-like [Rhagoletis zephyria]|uniref:basic-leucine zipper transcription factor A-like n=1 Tax=Rhagoletis zephyria TaxID=28612 RepID=UPI0008116B81|nr:PREDICTED: basic-leucine zipper transcription factor A-like [Rhagoletis zephyria]
MSSIRRCVVRGCPITSLQAKLFGWPKDQGMAQKWRQNLGISPDAHIAPTNTFICGDHFPDYAIGGQRLKSGAVPTLNLEYYQISDDDLNDDSVLEIAERTNGQNLRLGRRGSYERAWTTEATRALIHVRGSMQAKFSEGRQKRTELWLHITRELQNLGFHYSEAKVQKKWHNIIITYSKNLPKKITSGCVQWEFFEDMHKYLKDKKVDMSDFQYQSASNHKPPVEQQQQQQELPQQKQQPQSERQQHQHQQPQQQPQPQPQPQPLPISFQQSLEVNCSQLQTPSLQTEVTPQYSEGNQLALLANTAAIDLDKFNDEFDEDSTVMSVLKQQKLEFSPAELPLEIQHTNGYEHVGSRGKCDNDEFPPICNGSQDDGTWWKDYFERKLEVEREKIQCQKELHREQMQFHKMSLLQQESIERLKIDAINSLTATLQKLVETKNRKV